MKDILKGYYLPNDEEFKSIWSNAYFVFDTNILFNLYRWPKSVRENFIKATSSIAERVWLPHQVALEYQRGRLKIIADQKKKYSEVIQIFKGSYQELSKNISNLNLKQRHSEIDPDKTLEKINKVIISYLAELEKMKNEATDVYEKKDVVRDEIENIFKDKIGLPLSNSGLENLYKKGNDYYANGRPPGFEDISKDESQNYYYNGQKIIAKFGDAILWQQMLDYVSSFEQPQSIIFITDDKKADWWQIVKSEGDKTIGPRPELIEDMQATGKVNFFHMYNSTGFLRYAQIFLTPEVSDESIQLAKDIQDTSSMSEKTINSLIIDKKAIFATEFGAMTIDNYYKITKSQARKKLSPILYRTNIEENDASRVANIIKPQIESYLVGSGPIRGMSDYAIAIDEILSYLVDYYPLDGDRINEEIFREAVEIALIFHGDEKYK
ncbi:MAG: hypothetical protein EOO61_00815 [Hymenobacter sp.]|nr:MAG: hypothetical protein EOO61_00815 [Hymenobacter sp.]